MAKELPENFELKSRDPQDLSAADKAKYDLRRAEEDKRKDVNAPGIPQDALDCVEELLAANRSPTEAFTVYGYGLRVVKAAQAEKVRIVAELGRKPSKDVEDGILKVADIQANYSISEFTPKPAPEPVIE